MVHGFGQIRAGRVPGASDSWSGHSDLSAETRLRAEAEHARHPVLAGLRHANQFRAPQRAGADSAFGDALHLAQQRMNGRNIVRRHGDLDHRRYLLQGFARSHTSLYRSVSTHLSKHSAQNLSRLEQV